MKEDVPEDYMVSPASGKVINLSENSVSIFMHIYNRHVNIAPIDGVVSSITYKKGAFFPAFVKRSDRNERNIIRVKTAHGMIEITQIAGFLARRIRCVVKEGDIIKRGQVIGKIFFGSRVDVSVPADKFSIVVQKGERVRYGKTIIAKAFR